MFQSGSGKPIDFTSIPDEMLAFFNQMQAFDCGYEIIIGTDSQNHDSTKVVTVICIICNGHGGRYWFEITKETLIKDVRTKLRVETTESLSTATKLVELLEENKKYEDMYLSCPISIHVDAGNSTRGKTRELIPEIVGWVKAC